jgi:hypothetical protein
MKDEVVLLRLHCCKTRIPCGDQLVICVVSRQQFTASRDCRCRSVTLRSRSDVQETSNTHGEGDICTG